LLIEAIIANDDGDSPIGGMGGIVLLQQSLVGESAHLADAALVYTEFGQGPASGVGTVGGQLPIRIIRASVRPRVGVSLDRDFIG